MLRNKDGVSSVIATVFIILLSILGVVILFNLILPSIKTNLDDVSSDKVDISIETDGGYTVWDETNKLVKVQIKRGQDNLSLDALHFKFFKGGNSLNQSSEDVPLSGQSKTYSFTLGDFGKPELVTVSPIVGGTENPISSQGEVGELAKSGRRLGDGAVSSSDVDNSVYVVDNCFGDSDSDGFWEICTCNDLQRVGLDSLTLSKNYTLQNNIDCSETINWNSGKGFKPLGTDSLPFKNIFDGNGKIIKNLYIYRLQEDNIGLFGKIFNNSLIENIGLTGVNITGEINVGSLVGFQRDYSNVEEVYSTGEVKGTSNVGGLIGSQQVTSFLSNSYFVGNVNGESSVGGLIGSQQITSFLSNSYFVGNVNGESSVGGLIGTQQDHSDISYSYFVGNLTGNDYTGSLVGFQEYFSNIYDSYWNNISSNPEVCLGSNACWDCTAVQDNEDYFYDNSNEPMNSYWDFTSIWKENSEDFPSLN